MAWVGDGVKGIAKIAASLVAVGVVAGGIITQCANNYFDGDNKKENGQTTTRPKTLEEKGTEAGKIIRKKAEETGDYLKGVLDGFTNPDEKKPGEQTQPEEEPLPSLKDACLLGQPDPCPTPQQ